MESWNVRTVRACVGNEYSLNSCRTFADTCECVRQRRWLSSVRRVIKYPVCDIQFSITTMLRRELLFMFKSFFCSNLNEASTPYWNWPRPFFFFLFFFFDCPNPRLGAPSSLGSSTSSSWPLSPGCVSRGFSCTSCWWRSLRANTPERSTTTSLVTSSLPLWSASPQLSTTRAMGPRKRECSLPNKSVENVEQTLDATLCELTCCVCMRQLFKRNALSPFLPAPYVPLWVPH